MQHVVQVEDDTQVGEARRIAAAVSSAAGLQATEAGRVAIVVTELGTNIRKHAQRGELVIADLQAKGQAGVEVLALDRGPGMNVEVSMRDGHSTAGSRGEGLGAVKRLCQEFDAWSMPHHGAAIMGRVWTGPAPASTTQVGAVCVPHPSERECGDAWEVHATTATLRVLIADGLGHGPLAARASRTAVQCFVTPATQKEPGPEAILHLLHGALRSTRGAAIGVAELDLLKRSLRFGGIGNIGATLDSADGRPKGLLSHNGIAGHEARRIQEFTVSWPSRAVLIMHSDGIATQWKLEAYAGLQSRHPAVIAGVLYRDFRRKTDDATVVVVKEP